MIVMVQVADLSHENFKSSRVMRWWLSRLSSCFGAKSSRECKPKWLPAGLDTCLVSLVQSGYVQKKSQNGSISCRSPIWGEAPLPHWTEWKQNVHGVKWRVQSFKMTSTGITILQEGASKCSIFPLIFACALRQCSGNSPPVIGYNTLTTLTESLSGEVKRPRLHEPISCPTRK